MIRPLVLSVAGIVLLALPASTPAQSTPHVPPVLLQMIRDDAVHDELRLSEQQREAIVQMLPDLDERWFRARIQPTDQQRQQIDAATAELASRLETTLDDHQLNRLDQLQRQALGTRMVLRDDVATGLKLTNTQQQHFQQAFVETDTKSNEIQRKLREGELKGDTAQREITKLKNAERKTLVGQLSDQQRLALSQLTGSPFDFSKIKRMYPLAPELRSEGVTWIQGGPLALSQLRGKVVAVHYYAFQCINCKRNLPHYQAWHQDFANEDFVVIGIQTPETQAERSLERVSAAVKQEGIEYPIMLDADSTNWKAWSNTMWPTVYLIDKKGFIRRWWQGEMNWQGTPGEQQMRSTIESLLAEE